MSSYFRFFLSFNNLFGFIVCFVRSFSLSVNLSFCLSSVCSFVRHFVISVRMLLLLSVLRSFSIYLYFRSHRLPFSMFLPSGFSGYVFLSVIACFPSLLLSIFLSGFLLASGLRLRLLRSSATTRSDEPRALQKCGKLPVAGSLIWGEQSPNFTASITNTLPLLQHGASNQSVSIFAPTRTKAQQCCTGRLYLRQRCLLSSAVLLCCRMIALDVCCTDRLGGRGGSDP